MSSFTQKVLAIEWMGDNIKTYKLGDYFSKAVDVAKALNLSQTLAYIKSYHEVLHKEEIYHGLDHSLITFMNAVEGAIETGVSDDELRCVALAALFHDIGHSCGGKSDKYNIQTAREIFNRQRQTLPELLNLTDTDAICVHKCIEATFYPWKPTAKIDTTAKILRDADMMGAYISCPKTLKGLFNGLRNEIMISRFPYDVYTFMNDQDRFRTSLVWNTRWAKMKAIRCDWPGQFRRMRSIMLDSTNLY